MSSENIFWSTFWITVCVTLVCLFSLIPISINMNNEAVVKLVQEGATAMEASCAVHDSMGNNISCNLIITEGK